MKVTEIRFERRKNLGDYEHQTLTLAATVEDGETASAATERVIALVDWHLNFAERSAKYTKMKAIEEPTEAEQKWIAMYEERLAEMEKF